MSELLETQRDFIAYLRDQPNAMAGRVHEGRRAAAAKLLGIYRHAYTARLVESLGNDFPKLLESAGERRFQRLAYDYIRGNPSRSYSVRWVGDGIAEFLRRTPPWSDDPALADAADLDWAIAGAFDAVDAPTIGADEIARVPIAAWPTLRFDLHPSVRVARSWLVWRAGLEVKYRALEADEAEALKRLRDGAEFAGLCEALAESTDPDRSSYRAAELLRGWIDSGLIGSIRFEAPLST